MLYPAPSPHAKAVAVRAAEVIGVRPTIRAFYNNDESERVALALSQDWPRPGINCVLTVDLTTTPLALGGEEYELLAIAAARWTKLLNVVGDMGLSARVGNVVADPGMIWYNGLAPSYPDLRVRHLLVANPLEPPLRLTGPAGLAFPVRWLQLIPVTEVELKVLEDVGPDKFAELLGEHKVVIEDWGRESFV
jgi:hypothetical protein